MGGDEEIVGADDLPGPAQMGAYLRIVLISGFLERHNRDGVQ